MPPVGDHTSYLQKMIIRRKLIGSMELSDLVPSEFAYGNAETSLFLKSPDGSSLYQYGRLFDTTSTNYNTTWSGRFTKEYIDNAISLINIPTLPVKSMLFTAGGIAPTYTSGCSEPVVDDNTGTPIIIADFEQGESGFWNISIPGDYTGIISKITILYSGSSSNCTWQIRAKVLSDTQDIVTGGSWSDTISISDTPSVSNRLQKIEYTTPSSIFGSSSNAGNFAALELKLSVGTGIYNLLQVKFEY